jgi:hypothetical protein
VFEIYIQYYHAVHIPWGLFSDHDRLHQVLRSYLLSIRLFIFTTIRDIRPGPQTSNFSCAEPNENEVKQRTYSSLTLGSAHENEFDV